MTPKSMGSCLTGLPCSSHPEVKLPEKLQIPNPIVVSWRGSHPNCIENAPQV